MGLDTLLIIPAYNEEKAISNVIGSIRELYPSIDIAVINDGSSDKTAYLAEAAGAVVLSHPFNMGYGVSVQTGYKYAVRNNYSYLVQIDGDGQHDPEGIGRLLPVVKGGSADIALGSRFLGSGDYKTSMYRLIGIKVFRLVLFMLSGQRIKDVTTGFQAMNRRVLDLFISDAFPCDFPDADVILLLALLGFKISEVPVKMYPREHGVSMHKNPFKILYYIFKMLLSMILTGLRKYKV